MASRFEALKFGLQEELGCRCGDHQKQPLIELMTRLHRSTSVYLMQPYLGFQMIGWTKHPELLQRRLNTPGLLNLVG